MSIQFVVTRQRDLLEQYYQLREKHYRLELGLTAFDGGEDELDRRGTVLLAVEDSKQQVVAGARIFGSYPDNPVQLPLETEHFQLNNVFTELDLQRKAYCHWSRFFIDGRYRSFSFSKDFILHMLETSRALGFDYAFNVTDRSRSRYYRLVHSALGYNYELYDEELHTGEHKFNGLQHLVSYAECQQKPEIQGKVIFRADMAILRDWQTLPTQESSVISASIARQTYV